MKIASRIVADFASQIDISGHFFINIYMAYYTLSPKLSYDNSSLPDNTSYLNKHNTFKI